MSETVPRKVNAQDPVETRAGLAIGPVTRYGRIVSAAGSVVRVAGVYARLGDRCELLDLSGARQYGEVIAIDRDTFVVAVHRGATGIGPATRIRIAGHSASVPVGAALLGRIIDAYGEPLDGKGPVQCSETRPLDAPAPAPLDRIPISTPFHTGVRSIDGTMTLGRGQRVAILAPAAAGKTTLLGSICKFSAADVNVIALIGERGREVREFIDDCLGAHALARSVVVVATSDRSPTERLRAAQAATTIAEYFRDSSKHVLLLVDSLTRYARAYRDMSLAQGEAPARRGYPASLFALLPCLLERAGTSRDPHGTITALYTVLIEDPQQTDVIAEEVISLLDGHIALSRVIAESGRYPAVDVTSSVSRLMMRVVDQDANTLAIRLRALCRKYGEIETLVQMGEYQRGHDHLGDEALQRHEAIERWLSQRPDEASAPSETVNTLTALLQ